MRKFRGKNALVVGLGKSGCLAAEFLVRSGAHVIGVDRQNVLEKKGVLRRLGVSLVSDSDVGDIDIVLVSPGVPHDNNIIRKARSAGIEIIGEAELACAEISAPIVGITGTNGKTTVTLMAKHILESSGISAYALGNVGEPLTAYLLNGYDGIVIAELSSYQLETMTTRCLDVAVLLNITPDHLDRYPSMLEYTEAKARIIDIAKDNAKVYISEKLAKEFDPDKVDMFGYLPTSEVFTNSTEIIVNESVEYILPLGYRNKVDHDIENIVAAYAICRELGVSSDQFDEGLKTFHKPPHRIEFVKNIDGVAYYNDSKGTNIHAVIRAVESLTGNIVLIAGGVDKGASYELWRDAFDGKVKHVLAIGQSAQKIKRSLMPRVCVDIIDDGLSVAVDVARTLAEDGDIVLLSPGCASFDMFEDYAHRGDEFKRLVTTM